MIPMLSHSARTSAFVHAPVFLPSSLDFASSLDLAGRPLFLGEALESVMVGEAGRLRGVDWVEVLGVCGWTGEEEGELGEGLMGGGLGEDMVGELISGVVEELERVSERKGIEGRVCESGRGPCDVRIGSQSGDGGDQESDHEG